MSEVREEDVRVAAEGYTEQDVRWLAERIETSRTGIASDGYVSVWQCTKEEIAEQALKALAGAGRLLPEDTHSTVEDEIEWRKVGWKRGGVEEITYVDYDSERLAREFEAARKLGREMLSHRRRTIREFPDGSTLVGPWVPVPERDPLRCPGDGCPGCYHCTAEPDSAVPEEEPCV